MKYFFRVLIVLVIASGIVFAYSYHYRQEKNSENIVLTTADMSAKHETTEAQRELICENTDGNYQLYLYNGEVILCHDGIEKVLDGWASNVKLETPVMYFKDYDNDGENELLIKLANNVTNINGKQEYIYNLYLFEPAEKNGKSDFDVVSATSNTWKAPFESAIKAEMSQLKSCDKIIQFVMDDADTPITYNEETGITNNKYPGFACALRNNQGGYEKLERWNKGLGLYSVDDNGDIFLDIQVMAYYKNVDEVQYIGNIHSEIGIIDGKFGILPNTISFVANDEYRAATPLDVSNEKWTSTIYNSYTPAVRADDDMIIDWLEAELDLSKDFTEKTLSFSGISSQIKCVDKIVVTPSSLTFTAKEGYTFSESVVKKFDYFVTIRPDTDFSYNIEYTGEIKTVDGRSVLVINFDRAYDREKLNGMRIKFGV